MYWGKVSLGEDYNKGCYNVQYVADLEIFDVGVFVPIGANQVGGAIGGQGIVKGVFHGNVVDIPLEEV